MCLLFCFVLFWILCCVVCEKMKIKKLLITKKKKVSVQVDDIAGNEKVNNSLPFYRLEVK